MATVARNVYLAPNAVPTISRIELINWVNELAGTNYTKVEQLCSGYAYCRIFADLFPGTLNMNRVKESAIPETIKIANLKVLQLAFMKVSVDKVVPIEMLIKGKFQGNLEFLQWFRKFHEANGGDKMPPAAPLSTSFVTNKSSPRTGPVASKRATGAIRGTPTATTIREVDPALIGENTTLKKEIQLQKESLLALERERDFYFNKLLTVEGLCQEDQDKENELITRILEILYETDDGFEKPAANNSNSASHELPNEDSGSFETF
eukprot:CFRG6361T1